MGSQEDNRATAESVDMHLNMLRGAVAAYGGFVEVVGVEAGTCHLKYKVGGGAAAERSFGW